MSLLEEQVRYMRVRSQLTGAGAGAGTGVRSGASSPTNTNSAVNRVADQEKRAQLQLQGVVSRTTNQ